MTQYPELTLEQIQKIRQLEKELGDVCLLAVHRADAVYAVETKVGRNAWKPVQEVYGDIRGLRSFFLSREDAQQAKNSLKSFLQSKAGRSYTKQPIRVAKISEPTPHVQEDPNPS